MRQPHSYTDVHIRLWSTEKRAFSTTHSLNAYRLFAFISPGRMVDVRMITMCLQGHALVFMRRDPHRIDVHPRGGGRDQLLWPYAKAHRRRYLFGSPGAQPRRLHALRLAVGSGPAQLPFRFTAYVEADGEDYCERRKFSSAPIRPSKSPASNTYCSIDSARLGTSVAVAMS